MIDLIEVFDRAEVGPLISETDYYMKRYVPKLAEVIARHKVKWDKETIINTDDDLTDRVFQAAVDLLAEAGAYCPETNRVMQFTREEILLACSQAPRSATFGEDRERKTMYGRRPDTTDDRPWVHVGGGIYTTDEQVFMDTVRRWPDTVRADQCHVLPPQLADGSGRADGTLRRRAAGGETGRNRGWKSVW